MSPLCAISTINCEQVKPLNVAQLPEKETPCLDRCSLETMSIFHSALDGRDMELVVMATERSRGKQVSAWVGIRASADWLNCLNKIDKKDSKIDFEMSVIVVEAIRG